jgi:hypothetical protein
LEQAGDLPTAQQRTRAEPPTSPPASSILSREAFAIASSPPVVSLALRMSMFIGTLLNLINQGDALFGDAPFSPAKLLLTYSVPYCVATFSATSVSLRLAARAQGSRQ